MPINQSINQSNQPTNQPNQSINQSQNFNMPISINQNSEPGAPAGDVVARMHIVNFTTKPIRTHLVWPRSTRIAMVTWRRGVFLKGHARSLFQGSGAPTLPSFAGISCIVQPTFAWWSNDVRIRFLLSRQHPLPGRIFFSDICWLAICLFYNRFKWFSFIGARVLCEHVMRLRNCLVVVMHRPMGW